jgi:hypothetical protein
MSLYPYGWFLDGHPSGTLIAASAGALIPAGKYYFEVTVDHTGDGSDAGWGVAVGIASSTMASLFDIVDASVNNPQAASTQANFLTVKDNTSNGSGWGYPDRPVGISPVQDGEVIGVAVNTIAKTLWWRNVTDASVWNLDGAADPATGAGTNTNLWSALGASPITGNVYILVGADLGNNGGFGSPFNQKGKGTVNFGATAFTGTAPSGFVSIESVYPGAALNPNDNSDLTLTNGNLTFEGLSRNATYADPYCACRSRFAIAQA